MAEAAGDHVRLHNADALFGADEVLVNWLAQYVPMTHAQRQNLLELNSVLLRAKALIALIEAKNAVTASLR